MSAQQQKIRRFVWTVSIAAVTATGAWYGAGLKMRHEANEVVQKRREATPAEKIAQLEEQRSGLIAKRLGLERKIVELEARKNGATHAESKVGQERR